MKREFTGSTDKFDNKLYIGDKVKASNGAIGTISKYWDTWTYDEPQFVYIVQWGKYSNDTLGDAIGNRPRKRNEFLEKIF